MNKALASIWLNRLSTSIMKAKRRADILIWIGVCSEVIDGGIENKYSGDSIHYV